MQDITLQALLEAGCHFGHKSERWHPKAAEFIYTEKDGIHIIDLAKTKAGLEAAAVYIKQLTMEGKDVLFVATKRQARGVVKQEVEAVGAPYFVERWIGGFLTNWESIKKNIDKIIRLEREFETGVWKKFPKHEQSKLTRYVARLKIYYGGVLKLSTLPAALFIVDIKKEIAALREAKRMGIPIVAIVDTNADPVDVDYVIPANDDAVGSIQYLTHVIAQAYNDGHEVARKKRDTDKEHVEPKSIIDIDKPADVPVKRMPTSAKATAGKRGRPKKANTTH